MAGLVEANALFGHYTNRQNDSYVPKRADAGRQHYYMQASPRIPNGIIFINQLVFVSP